MADENYDIAKDFASATDSQVEVVNESAPDVNSGDVTQNSNVIDLTESESPLEDIQEAQGEQTEQETDSSLTDGEVQQEDPQSETTQEEGTREVYEDDALFVLNEKYGTDYDNLDESLDDLN